MGRSRCGTNIWKRDRFISRAQVLQHVLDQDGTLSNFTLCTSGQHEISQSNKTPTTKHIPTVISTPSELWRVMVLAEAILGVDEVSQVKQALLYEEIYLSSATRCVSSSAPSDKAALGFGEQTCRESRETRTERRMRISMYQRTTVNKEPKAPTGA